MSHIFLLGYILVVLFSTPTQLNWPVKIVFWTFCLALYWLIGLKNQEGEIAINNKWLIAPIIILLTTRFIPFLHWGEFPLGADAGTYIYNFGKYISVPALYSSYILLNLLVGIVLYIVTKEYFNKEAALISLLVFSLSTSQFLTYWLVYGKMMVAIFFTLLSFYFIKKQSWWLILSAVAVGFFHPISFLPFILSLILLAIFGSNKKFLLVSIITILVAVFFLSWEDFTGYLYYAEKYLRGNYLNNLSQLLAGHFVPLDFYQGFLAIIYLPFSFIGLMKLVYKKDFNVLFYYFISNATLIYLNFVFHNRFVILMDIMLIILAGSSLLGFIKIIKNTLIGKVGLLIGLLIIFGNIIYQSWSMEPIINIKELNEIKNLSYVNKEIPIISTDSRYYPILLGYSQHDVLDEELTEESINKYKGPLYIYSGRRGRKIDFEKLGNFQQITDNLWKL